MGGIEALAGLIPIDLHLRRMAKQAALRGSTLTGTHPLWALFPLGLSQRAHCHSLSMTSRPHPRAKKIVGPVPDMVTAMPEVTEWFDLVDGLAATGNRIRDLFPNQIFFDKSPRASDREAEEESRSGYLDHLLLECEKDPEGIVVATDASVPSSTQHQSVVGFEAYVGRERVCSSCFASGRVLAPCAELVAIRFEVTRVTSGAELYKRITVFTDSIASAEQAVDPLLHSGQAHSLAVCKALNEWFLDNDDREIKFVEVPSSAKWLVHHSAHLFVRGLPLVGVGGAPQTSLDYLRKRATDVCQDAWVTRFQDAKYKGGQFLELNNLKGKPLQPKYTGGGVSQIKPPSGSTTIGSTSWNLKIAGADASLKRASMYYSAAHRQRIQGPSDIWGTLLTSLMLTQECLR
ncbi:hypothetical protein PQX77_001323 [Marasmius sp. AFHP31]|nr:hypothetical protein PQX77_001323 [Marasmius sp. AFHP31]